MYPTQNDSVPGNSIGSDPNQANYFDDPRFSVTGHSAYDAGQNYLTDVGSFTGSGSYYGTFDQGGNLWEWTDGVSDSSRKLRGSAWNFGAGELGAGAPAMGEPSVERAFIGFRLAGVPEPSSTLLLLLGGVFVSLRRTR